MLRGFWCCGTGQHRQRAGNKALTSADVQLVCTLSDALKRSAATALAQSTAATLAVERACASAEYAISDFARRARSKKQATGGDTAALGAKHANAGAGLSQKIGVDARLYALEAAQRAGRWTTWCNCSRHTRQPGHREICIVTADATTAKTSTDDAGDWVNGATG
ncbi:hypothetical protein ERJ75_000914300 [Trypanosoma vivax]|nr:hypothetical protein ERJ75_000914300 [Trypanosoma vivax]